MVNSKKRLGAGTILNIVFAVLLVISLAAGISAAWFTANASGTADIKFGTVAVGSAITVTAEATNLVPTQKVAIGEASYTGNVKAYYRAKMSVTAGKKADGSIAFTTEEINTLNGLLISGTAKPVAYGVFAASTGAAVTKDLADITIPETLTNTYQGCQFTIVVTLDVIQATGSSTTELTDASSEALFAAAFTKVLGN